MAKLKPSLFSKLTIGVKFEVNERNEEE